MLTQSTSSRKQRTSLGILLGAILILCVPPSLVAQLRAFPDAFGFGAFTPGGRGGTIKFVTNLNNSGPGSLRAAVEASGPRIVVFRVSGIINLTSELEISNPYITIAGQTAPGAGICLKGDQLGTETHDVIVRGLRVRTGLAAGNMGRGFQAGPDSRNVIIDHCSFSWSQDALVATWDTVSNITIQNCIISEVLSGGGHSVALGPGPGDNEDGSRYLTNASFIRNLVAHGEGRNPKVHYHAEVANNLVYNWENFGCFPSMYAELDFIGNYYKRGPSSGEAKTVTLDDPRNGMRIYVSGNRTPELPNGGTNQWSIVNGSTNYQSTTRLHSSGYTPLPWTEVFEHVLDNAGAIPRDPVDARIEGHVRSGTGAIIDNESQVGGYPNYGSTPAPPDVDNDGMPDVWETAHGLNPNVADGNNDRNGDGYTNIEEYINGLFTGEIIPPPSTIDCSEVNAMITRCLVGGTLKVKVGLKNTSHTGETVEITIDGVPHEGVIDNTGHALITVGGFSGGNHTATLTNPPGCLNPVTANCSAGASMDEWDEPMELEETQLPVKTSLVGNYPNPFNPTTTIRYQLAEDTFVSLRVYDMLGREVRTLVDGFVKAGTHEATFDASELVSGVYAYRLVTNSITEVKMLNLVK